MINARIAVAFIALICAAPTPAAAWWVEGHHVTARIARHFLDPKVDQKIQALLATDTDPEYPHDLRGASAWLDEYRAEGHVDVALWHFIFVELEQKGVDMKVNCPKGDCMIARIEVAETQLANPKVTGQDRVRALKYLVHFLGDLHQPLHVADNHDQAGNDVEILYFGRQASLHSIWDNDIVRRLDPNERTLSERLIADITPSDVEAWGKGSPVDWANESFAQAKSVVYAQLPVGQPAIIDDTYQDAAVPVVELQLKRAGVRIAKILNQLFAD